MILPTPFTLHTARLLAALGMGSIVLWTATSHAAEPVMTTEANWIIDTPTCTVQNAEPPAFSSLQYAACKQTLDNHIAEYQQTNDNAKLHTAYKALAWLTYANYKHHMNSRAPIADIAWQNAHTLINQLAQAPQSSAMRTDIPSYSALMRPDLWAYLSALQEKGATTLTPREMAFAEVSLLWAATAQCARGWRESTPHFRMASRYLMQADIAYRNHNPEDSVALSDLIQRYYQAYLPLDSTDDKCQGQVLPALS